jgi:hypothetical protein
MTLATAVASGRAKTERSAVVFDTGLDVVVTVAECLTRCLSLIEGGVVRLDGAGDISVEVLFP